MFWLEYNEVDFKLYMEHGQFLKATKQKIPFLAALYFNIILTSKLNSDTKIAERIHKCYNLKCTKYCFLTRKGNSM